MKLDPQQFSSCRSGAGLRGGIRLRDKDVFSDAGYWLLLLWWTHYFLAPGGVSSSYGCFGGLAGCLFVFFCSHESINDESEMSQRWVIRQSRLWHNTAVCFCFFYRGWLLMGWGGVGVWTSYLLLTHSNTTLTQIFRHAWKIHNHLFKLLLLLIISTMSKFVSVFGETWKPQRVSLIDAELKGGLFICAGAGTTGTDFSVLTFTLTDARRAQWVCGGVRSKMSPLQFLLITECTGGLTGHFHLVVIKWPETHI